MSEYLDYNYIHPAAFHKLLLTIFENNVFIFNQNYYIQTNTAKF